MLSYLFFCDEMRIDCDRATIFGSATKPFAPSIAYPEYRIDSLNDTSEMTKIALLNIGTELLRGRTINSNAATIGQMLLAAGYALETTLVIHDDGPVITAAIEDLLATHDVLLLTGGLGPTKDDITKKVLLELFGGEMVCHVPTLERIANFLKRLDRPMIPLNRMQADVPSSCTVMENEMGTAPGMAFLRDGKTLISMPGVPYEMKFLMEHHVVAWLQGHYPVAEQHLRVVRTAGQDLDPRIAIAYLPSFDGTKIELKVAGKPEETGELQAVLDHAQQKVAQLLKTYVYSLQDKSPDKLLADWLIQNNKTFATAESCTGGEIAAKLVKHSGISAVLKGGIVAYMAEIKENVLGVKQSTIAEKGIVSEEVAREMAEGARRIMGSDYAVAITGIAEAAKDAPKEALPQAWIALAGPEGTSAFHTRMLRDRKVNIEIAAYAALIFALRAVGAPV
jgi:nicotinamide-nucleotide amidase